MCSSDLWRKSKEEISWAEYMKGQVIISTFDFLKDFCSKSITMFLYIMDPNKRSAEGTKDLSPLQGFRVLDAQYRG